LAVGDRPSDPSSVLDDGLGDWRFRSVHKIQRAGREQFITALGQLQTPSGETFEFADFMPVALYLNVAMAADTKANELRDLIAPEQFVATAGPYTTIRHEKLGTLFDFIEQSALAAVFSFLALEAYSNFVIHFELRDGEHVFTCPRQPRKQLPADEIERCGETMEKLKTIVPQLLQVDPPTKESFWPKLWDMKRVRDALVHLKFKDQMGAATTAASADSAPRTDPDFVFYKLVSGEFKVFPQIAVEVVDYFTKRSGTPRWLLYPLSVYGIPATAPKGRTTITIRPVN
jgi:hypothetical protein